MLIHSVPHGFMPVGTLKELVRGLREDVLPSEIRVYSATTGKLLRIEQPWQRKPRFNNRRKDG